MRLPYTTLDDKPYYHRLITAVCAEATALCTVSEASRKDILSFFPTVSPKLHNTYQSFRTDATIRERSLEHCAAEISAEFGLTPHSYFMFFGSLEPKKNIGRLIEGFLTSSSNRKLVLVGAMAWRAERELRYLERGIETGRIIHIDYLPERSLFSLLRLTRAVLFPSLCEGFGLPVLEAMNFGVPALISQEGALPEVGGNAALQTNAYDVDAITSAIDRLDRDDTLCRQLGESGLRQAIRFDMTNYCARLNTLYSAALHEKA
ncbi:glycosyltransferase family 4 protein [Asaia prunellae]|uniref:glycosyltransferase family 4 protein n=1 Tax=Asaia prunellae TaxID=610245 RepID=UPI001FB0CCCE|nr:glycosyltransferase family 1 protein [Asaia prunellae]